MIPINRCCAFIQITGTDKSIMNGAGIHDFFLHPPGEVHEYENGPGRTMLFRVRYGADMRAHHCAWRGNAEWKQSGEDADYYRRHPIG